MARRRAFTLIELLVVVAIIALLISILLPVLGRAREQAKQTVCASNARQMGLAFYYYIESNRDTFPFYRAAENSGADVDNRNATYHWFERIRWYILNDKSIPRDYDAFRCWRCPSSEAVKYDANFLTYGYNYTHLGDWPVAPPVITRYARIRETARTIVVADSHDATSGLGMWGSVISPADYWVIYPVGPRHRGKANVLWADWHVDLQNSKLLNSQRRLVPRQSDYWWDVDEQKRSVYGN